MTASNEFRHYLQSICSCSNYKQWWTHGVLTDTEREQLEPFDFDLRVKKVKPQQTRGTLSEKPCDQNPPLPAIKTLHQYVASAKQVLLVGRPGAGKTKTLLRYLLELAKQAMDDPSAKIPILVQLKDYKAPLDEYSGIIHLIRKDLKSWGFFLELEKIERYLFQERVFLLLIDGLNELSSSQEAQKDLRQFRDMCYKRRIPTVFATRVLGYRSLEVKTQLEIQPITLSDKKRFLEERVPPSNRQKLQEWLDRARQSDYTPFVMWMLATVCQQVNSSSQSEGFSIGKAFREFVRSYQDRIYEEGKVSDEDCEKWTSRLEHLASEMMTDERFENFVISRVTAIKILGSEILLNNLVQHHLLVELQGKSEIAFCHQLLQEYYVAEWLRSRLSSFLETETGRQRFQYDYFNYLRWTESIAILIGLPEISTGQAEKLIEIALGVDLILGSRLAGKVNQALQNRTVNLIAKQQVCEKLRIRMLGETCSEAAAPLLIDLVENEDSSIRSDVVHALGKISGRAAISGLIKALNDDNYSVRSAVVDALEQIGGELIIPGLVKALEDRELRGKALLLLGKVDVGSNFAILSNAIEHLDSDIRWGAAIALTQMDSEKSVLILLKAIKNPNYDVQFSAAFALGKMGFEIAVPVLQREIEFSNSSNIQRLAIHALAKIDSERAVLAIQELSQASNSNIWDLIAKTLLSMDLEDFSPTMYRVMQDPVNKLKASIDEILNTEDISDKLFQATQESNPNVLKSAAFILRRIGIPEMLSALWEKQTKIFQEDIAETISSIQSRCQFYNHEIYQQAQAKEKPEFKDVTYTASNNQRNNSKCHYSKREEYERILRILHHMNIVMERDPDTFSVIGEEALRSHFLVQLNGIYEGQATGETFNCRGKTDIIVRFKGENIFIGECKFWGGDIKLQETLEQLLAYTTLRDDQLGILIFNRNKDFSTVLRKIPVIIRSHSSFLREASHSETEFRFILKHPNDSECELHLAILAFNIPSSSR